MELKETLYVTNRKDWRSWLAKHHKNKKEIWLIYYKKHSGKPRIPYNDAADEALCYGWIDSIIKKIDEERFTQRFTPRKPKSNLSQMNKERIRELIKSQKMTEWGLKAVAHVFDPDTDDPDDFIIPLEILKALQANKDAWKYFQKMSPLYQRIRIAYIDGYRQHDVNMYRKKLAHFIEKTAQNKRIGSVRDKYDLS